MLSLANVVSFNLDQNPTGLFELARDRGAEAQRHTLATADADEMSRVIIELVESAGLIAECIVPSEAVMMIAAVRKAQSNAKSGNVSAVLWMGEESSILAAVDSEKVRFVRPISLGAESIVEALTRPITLRDRSETSITLDRDAARTMLATTGIPDRESIIDSATGLTGASVLPLLQPVLQRLTIEIKQSMRFGLGDADRTRIQLSLLGAGSTIPGLESLLAQQTLPQNTEAPVASRQITAANSPVYLSSEHGQIRAYASYAAGAINLVPAHLAERTDFCSTRRLLYAGLALCGAIVTVEGAFSWLELQDLSRTQSVATTSSSASIDDRELMESAIESLESLESRMARSAMPSPAWGPLVSSVMQAAPNAMKLNYFDIRLEDGRATATIAGRIDGPESAEASAMLKSFVQELSSLPLISSVQLRQTQRLRHESRDIQQFEIATPLVLLPPHGMLPPSETPPPLATVPGDES